MRQPNKTDRALHLLALWGSLGALLYGAIGTLRGGSPYGPACLLVGGVGLWMDYRAWREGRW